MTLSEIFDTFTPGSPDFVRAVQKYCDFGMSDLEIRRVANDVFSAEQFLDEWRDEIWWKDGTSEIMDELFDAEEKHEDQSSVELIFPIQIFDGFDEIDRFNDETDFETYVRHQREIFRIPDRVSNDQIMNCLERVINLNETDVDVDPTVAVYRWNDDQLSELADS